MKEGVQTVITWLLLMMIGGMISIAGFYLYQQNGEASNNVIIYDQFYLQKQGITTAQAHLLAEQYVANGYVLLKGNAVYSANKKQYLGYNQDEQK